jgi:glycosyltransferase involved in cell wall biosynthesis
MTEAAMTVSVIVPTKNRPVLLAETMRALLAQTAMPAELIVIDQSATDEGRRAVAALLDAVPPDRRPVLVHLLDATINGAAAARNVGLDLAAADVVVFCDDDVVPDPNVIERLLGHYARDPGLAGVAPLIANYAHPGWPAVAYQVLFCRGPFRDERLMLYWFWRRRAGQTLVPVRMFTGAMMSFRRAVLGGLRYDARYRAASVGEDIDLCWSLRARGGRLAIALDARIAHNKAPRPARRPEEALLTSWAFLYDKHVSKTPGARLAFAWFVVGVLVGSLYAAVRERTIAPIVSGLAGVRGILSDYAGSSFLAPDSIHPPGRWRRPGRAPGV